MIGVVIDNEMTLQALSFSSFYAFLIMLKVKKEINYFYEISNNIWSLITHICIYLFSLLVVILGSLGA